MLARGRRHYKESTAQFLGSQWTEHLLRNISWWPRGARAASAASGISVALGVYRDVRQANQSLTRIASRRRVPGVEEPSVWTALA